MEFRANVLRAAEEDNCCLLIQSVNRESVTSTDEFEKAIAHTKDNKVLLLVKRGQFSQFVVIPLSQ